jgi:hypothetical protein
VRPWAALLLTATAVAVVVRPLLSRRNPGRTAVAGCLALVVPALTLGWAEVGDRRMQAQLASVITELADAPAAVHCQRWTQTWFDASGHVGFVPWDADGNPTGVVQISYDGCRSLRAWLNSDRNAPTPDQIDAVHVVAHEAFHIAGVHSEADTECYSVQRTAWVAQALGATAQQAADLARAYWADTYPHLPDDYRTADCHDGGRLDLDPASPMWP